MCVYILLGTAVRRRRGGRSEEPGREGGGWARAAWAWAEAGPGPGPGGARAKNKFPVKGRLRHRLLRRFCSYGHIISSKQPD